MSIGKNSIARAVNATAKTQNTNTEIITTKLSLDKIGLLTVAKIQDDISDIKQSISKRGVLCPLLVAATPKGDIWLLDGYRRFFAAKELDLSQLNATIINVENKSEANRICTELYKLKLQQTSTNIHEEKFRVLHVKDHDLPPYLL